MRSYPQSRFDAIFIGKSGIDAVAYHAQGGQVHAQGGQVHAQGGQVHA